MPDPYRHLQHGDRFEPSAAAWNAFADTARLFAQQGGLVLPAGRSAGARGRAGMGTRARGGGGGQVLVKNATGGDVAQFGVMAVGTPLFGVDELGEFIVNDEFRSFFDLVGVTPDIEVHLGRFVIAAEPIADGRIGRCYAIGVCPVRLEVIHASDRFADIRDANVAMLRSRTSGAAEILWKETAEGTGEMWAVVRIGVSTIHHGPFAGVITDVDTGAKTYDARASHDTTITVSGAAPLMRPFDVAQIPVTLAEIGDPCTLMVLEDRTVVLWSVPELWGTEPACEAPE